jgi:hypothetical protein
MNSQWTHSCAKLSIFELLTVTVAQQYTRCIVAYPFQQWLRERATALCYTYVACLVTVRFYWRLDLSSDLFPFRFLDYSLVCFCYLSSACYLPTPSHVTRCYNPDTTWWIKGTWLLTVQFLSSHNTSMHSSQHPVLEHPRFVLALTF